MRNLTLTLGRLAVVVASALTLGACSRAEYATLPRTASYMGSVPLASKPRPVAPAVVVAPAAPAAEALAPASLPEVAPLASTTPAAAPLAATTAPKAAAPAKLNLVQRMALANVTKKLTKLAAKTPQFKQHDAAASTARIDGNLRTGIILVVIGLIVSLFSNLIGTIIALIGLVFLVLWLLDAL